MAGRGSEPEQTYAPPAEAPVAVWVWRLMPLKFRAWVVATWQELQACRIELRKNSHNSSLPPSRDGSEEKAKTNAFRRRHHVRKRRRPGGQDGHPGHQRALVPPERVDRRIEYFPRECRRCKRDLDGVAVDAEPLHHQVAEIPEIRPIVTDHVQHRVTCPDCRTRTTASLPDDVPRVCFGANLRALVVLLIGRYRISWRETVDLCLDVFGLSVSVGSIGNIVTHVSGALAVPYDEIASTARESAVCYMDETGWREKGKALHLWILVTALVVLFRIGRRTKKVAQEMLGEQYAGIGVTDRYVVYRLLADERHQVCWSHLKRNFEGLVERGGEAATVGEACLGVSDKLFATWHAYKEGRIPRATMQRRMAKVEMRAGQVFQEGCGSRSAAARTLCESLCKIGPSLFVFARTEGVEPTNNTSERCIRPAVQWRKICFGTQSGEGSRFVERILTVVATCRLQGRSLLAYLRDVIVAADSGGEIPSLVHAATFGEARCHGPPRVPDAIKTKKAG